PDPILSTLLFPSPPRRPPTPRLFPYTTLFRSARFVQRRIKKITRAVTREHPPRAIRSMRRRRQSQNQKLRASVSESRDGFSPVRDRKSTRLNSSHRTISYAVFCLKKKTTNNRI